MSEQNDTPDLGSGSKRERSPNFPYLGLGAAIELTKTLYEAAKNSEVRVVDIAEPWGLSPKSGSLGRYASAASQYGLIDASGSGEKRRIRISTTGRRIIEDNRPGVREDLCREAALKPAIIREVFRGSDRISAWGHDRPIDTMAESALIFDLSFTSDAAKRFLSVFDETISYVPKIEVAPESEPEVESGSTTEDDLSHGDSGNASALQSPPTPATSMQLSTELNKIVFKSEGDGTISISARVDKDGLAILEEKIPAFRALLD